MKDPHLVILRPYITERSMALSYGDMRATDESKLVRKYTFLVATTATKIDIKRSLEAIYNAGKKKADDMITVTTVRTVTIHGKTKRRGVRSSGKTPERKKAIVTLAPGQMLEDYGV